MLLAEWQSKRLQDWLSTRHLWPRHCPVCKRGKWHAGEIILSPISTGNGFSPGGSNAPMVQMVCDHCAYVLLFAAVPIGLVKRVTDAVECGQNHEATQVSGQRPEKPAYEP